MTQVVSHVDSLWDEMYWDVDFWDGGDYLSDMRKRYEFKIYSAEGVFLTTWTDVINEPSFETVINGGFVELVAQLARKTDDFGEERDVRFGNELQLWCFDNDNPRGQKIFAGYISRYEPKNDGPTDRVDVHFLGYHQRLTDFIYENNVGETLITNTDQDPGEMAEQILDAVAPAGCPVSWSEGTLQKTGTIATYTFQQNTAMEALDKVEAMSPVGWYWYVDANKNFNLHPKQIGAVHTFTIGKEIFYIDADKRVENIVNRIYFTGGVPEGQTQPLYSRYEYQPSIQAYGMRSIKKSDSSIIDQATMDLVANNILEALKDVEIRCVIRVKDNDYDRENGYDIESIKIGDTCQIRNYQDTLAGSLWDVMTWDDGFWDFNVRNLTEIVMQIVDIKYTPNYVELTISSKIPNISKRIEDINKLLISTIVANNPPSPAIGV